MSSLLRTLQQCSALVVASALCLCVWGASALAGPGDASTVIQSAAATAPTEVVTSGQAEPVLPKPLQNIDIADRLGNRLPLDASLTDHNGNTKRLGDYFSGEESGNPVLLVLGYYSCPMLCSLVLNGALDALKEIDLKPGKNFRLVSISIDPRDNVEVAKSKRESYLKTYELTDYADGIQFHVADAEQSKRIADAVGFGYRWDEDTEQYAHAAGIFFVSPDGTLTRTLYGLTFQEQDVKFALMEASRGEVGSIVDKVILSCFSYTSDSQRYGVYVFGLFKLGGALTILFLGGLLITLWRRERIKAESNLDT